MERVITVKGIGKVNAIPDQIIVSLQIHSRDKNYEKTLQLANEQMDKLRHAVERCGLMKDDLKTESFRIDTEYDDTQDKNGVYRRIFKGFVCEQELKLRFPLDMILLASALSAISDSNTKPEFSIRFTIADSNQISEELLIDAAQNAMKKANVLVKAAGVTLGELIAINYSWDDINLYSHTEWNMDIKMLQDCSRTMSPIDIAPEDIQISDTVSFVWGIK